MKIEANRLQTFSNWSGNVPVPPERIAKGGFYATGNNLDVQCPWCKSKISEWRFGDIAVIARHRLLDPLCPFVVNPTSSGNTPISSQPTQSDVVPVDLMNEQCRLATFKNWPVCNHYIVRTCKDNSMNSEIFIQFLDHVCLTSRSGEGWFLLLQSIRSSHLRMVSYYLN